MKFAKFARITSMAMRNAASASVAEDQSHHMPGLLSPSRYFGEMECGLLMDALWNPLCERRLLFHPFFPFSCSLSGGALAHLERRKHPALRYNAPTVIQDVARNF
jgi:hypothetical protein